MSYFFKAAMLLLVKRQKNTKKKTANTTERRPQTRGVSADYTIPAILIVYFSAIRYWAFYWGWGGDGGGWG